MKTNKVKIDEKLYSNIFEYCKINGLEIEEYVNNLLKKNFMIDKYGERPSYSQQVIVSNEPVKNIEEVIEENNIQTSEKNSVCATEEKVIETIEHEENILEVTKKKNIRKLK